MLKGSDLLEINMNDVLTTNDLDVLNALYLPLIKSKALTLYNTLVMLANKKVKINNHKLLIKLCNQSIGSIEDNRGVLEKYGLIKTYYNSLSNKFLIVVIKPKEGSSFLKHEVYGRLYLNAMGEEITNLMKSVFSKNLTRKKDYIDMSLSMTNLLKDDWNLEDEKVYKQIKKDISSQENKQEVNFNYDIFLANYEAIWPKNKRLKKDLDMIGEIATLYGISEKAMRRIVSRSINLSDYSLDVDKLKKYSANSKAKYEPSSDNKYKWAPIRFLESKQPDTPISKNDKEIIEMLLMDYHFNAEVTNVLIEHVLQSSDNKLIKKYVESVAASWSRSKVDTFDKAIAKVNGKKVDAKAAWSKSEDKKDNKKENKQKLSEEERLALINSIKGE